MLKPLCPVLIFLFLNLSLSIHAQDTLVMAQTGNSGVFNTCYATIWDPGMDSNYTNDVHATITIAPLWVEQVNLYFEVFDTEIFFDSLTIYDGPGTAFPKIGTYSGTGLQGQTISSTSNSITLEFDSDDIVTHAGFKILVSCLMGNENESIIAPVLYPNPVGSSFCLQNILQEKVDYMYITDISGRILETRISSNIFDVSGFSSGVYGLVIQFKNGHTHFLKWIKA